MPSHPPAMSWLLPALRPTPAEVETYTRLILDREAKEGASYSTCRDEAEFQLWVARCLSHRDARDRRRARSWPPRSTSTPFSPVYQTNS